MEEPCTIRNRRFIRVFTVTPATVPFLIRLNARSDERIWILGSRENVWRMYERNVMFRVVIQCVPKYFCSILIVRVKISRGTVFIPVWSTFLNTIYRNLAILQNFWRRMKFSKKNREIQLGISIIFVLTLNGFIIRKVRQ